MFPLFFYLALAQLPEVLPDVIPDGITGQSPAFYAGVVLALWLVERVFGYVVQFRKDVTPESLAKAVKQSLTTTELDAMRLELAKALHDDPKTEEIVRKVGVLHEWHDREDPERPGWKIWWTSSKDYKALLEVARRQTELDRELLAALERRAELDRMMMNTLDTVTRAAANMTREAICPFQRGPQPRGEKAS
jgi:hypothetical protein